MSAEIFASCSCLMVVSPSDSQIELNLALRSIGVEQELLAAEYVIVLNGRVSAKQEGSINQFEAATSATVRVVKISSTKTLSEALNYGMKYCTQALVARMDPDDLSLPNRFRCQVDVFDADPELSILGSWIAEFNEQDGPRRVRRFPQTHNEICSLARFRNPLAHPAVMFRKRVIEDLGGYPMVSRAQDYLLWSRAISYGYKIENVPKVLLEFRVNSELLARRGMSYLKYEIEIFRLMKLEGFLNTRQYYMILLSKAFVRLMPVKIRKFFYKLRK